MCKIEYARDTKRKQFIPPPCLSFFQTFVLALCLHCPSCFIPSYNFYFECCCLNWLAR